MTAASPEDAARPGPLGLAGPPDGAGRAGQVVAVVGPTAAGKSALAVGLARALGGEVINADSMQLYRGMDIGTAKLTTQERQGVPHHLLDIWDVRQAASVAGYQRLARAVIDDVTARGRVPILAGGSGLYIRGALGDLNFPGTDQAVRERLETELAAGGAAALHTRLAALDPAAAAAILPSNGRRVVRALEVIEISGRPFTATLPAYESSRPAVQIGVRVPREELDRRIAARVDTMWRGGFEDEVRRLERGGLREGRTASRALGYAQMLRHLAGEWTPEHAREETIRATRRFARRQESWFRRDPRITWLDAGPGDDERSLLDRSIAAVPPLASNSGCARGQPDKGWPRKAAELRPKPQNGSQLPRAHTLLLILQLSRRLANVMGRTAGAIVLGLSACGYPLTQFAVRRWGARGTAVAESVSVGLAIRDASMVARGVLDRLLRVPATPLRLELLAAQDLARLPLLAAPATRFFVLRIDHAQLDTGARPVSEGPAGQPVSAATDRQRHPPARPHCRLQQPRLQRGHPQPRTLHADFPGPTAPSQPPGNTKPPAAKT